jgi:hypothetical protein
LTLAPPARADGTGVVTGADNRAVIAGIYESFETGDTATILGSMADDVVWLHPGPGSIPFAGKFEGKAGVQRFFDTAIASIDVLEQRVHTLLADGDQVAAIGFERMRVKATGREYASEWVHLYTLRDGKVVRFEEYIDTAALVAGFAPPAKP